MSLPVATLVDMSGALKNEARILRLAARSGGVCHRGDLIEAGVSANSIDRRVGTGQLKPVTRGVYVVESLSDDTTGLHVARLSLPDDALSHESAGRLRKLAVRPAGEVVDVLVPNGCRRTVPGLRLHQTRTLTEDDVGMVGPFRVTSLERTLVDLAGVLGRARLHHVVEDLVRSGRRTPGQLRWVLESFARRGVRGITKLRLILDEFDGDGISVGVITSRADAP